MPIDITATYLTGWKGDNGDFVSATCLYTINGVSVGFASDATMDLVDNHGVSFDVARRAIDLMWHAAQGNDAHRAVATLDDVVSPDRLPS